MVGNTIRHMRAVILTTMVVTAGIVLAVPASADVDTDFSNEAHTYGIYGPKDYNAWIAKLTCKRLSTGLDANANASAKFLHDNLPTGNTEQQDYQFLNSAINHYCDDQRHVLTAAAGLPAPAPAGAPLPAEQG